MQKILEYLYSLWDGGKKAFFVYPATLIFSLISTLLACILIHLGLEDNSNFTTLHLLFTTLLGTATLFFVENYIIKTLSFQKRVISYIVSSLLLFFVYWVLFYDSHFSYDLYLNYIILLVIQYLVIFIFPYFRQSQSTLFSQRNSSLVHAYVTAILYSTVLAWGFLIAVAFIHFLFDLDLLDGKLILYVHAFAYILFLTWIFLIKAPLYKRDPFVEEHDLKEIRFFSTYVLTPLILVYFAILYIYVAKMLLLWDWPQGGVVYLIMVVASVGLGNILLMYNCSSGQSPFVQKINRIIPFLLLPLMIVYFIAIGMRVSDYGITLFRYWVLLFGIWITGSAVVYILLRRYIQIWFVALCILGVISLLGPIGMYQCSERSQENRLTEILGRNGIELKDGDVVVSDSITTLTDKDYNDLESIVNYLNEYHEGGDLNKWFEDASSDSTHLFSEYTNLWRIESNTDQYEENSACILSSYSENYCFEGVSCKGFDYVVPIKYHSNGTSNIFLIHDADGNNTNTQLKYDKEKCLFEIWDLDHKKSIGTFDLGTVISEIEGNEKVINSDDKDKNVKMYISIEGDSESDRYQLNISNSSFNKMKDNSTELNSLTGYFLYTCHKN